MKIYKINGEEYHKIPQTIAYNGGRLSLPPTTTDAEWQSYGGTIEEREPAPPPTQEEQDLAEATQQALAHPAIVINAKQIYEILSGAVADGKLTLDLTQGLPGWGDISESVSNAITAATTFDDLREITAIKELAFGKYSEIVFHLGDEKAYKLFTYFLSM